MIDSFSKLSRPITEAPTDFWGNLWEEIMA